MDVDKKVKTLLTNTITSEQRTDEWYNKRHNLLTASDCASALESNPFQTKQQLFNKKIKPYTITDYTNNPIDAIEHGIKYEPIALKQYQKFQNTLVHQVGLYIHKDNTWLGASPDGITETGKLVEIKCIYRRYLYDKPPLYYWIQTQIQMEVTDIDECDLFQCKFIEYSSKKDYKKDNKTSLKGKYTYNGKIYYWKLEQYKCTTIKRDKSWFKRSLPLMKSFWNNVIQTRKNNSNNSNNSKKIVIKRKRKNDENSKTIVHRSRTLSVDNVYEDWNEWISATSIRSYALKDPLLYYLNMYGKSYGIKTDDEIDASLDSGKFLKEQGIQFEEAVCDNIIHRIGVDKIVKIGSYEEAFSKYKADITKQAMIEGYPIIMQGVLHDSTTKTYGVVDIICRSDYLSKIFEHHPLDPKFVTQKAPKISKKNKFHYTIIDIKYTTLRLYKDTENLCNDPQTLYNKMQVCIYNQALGNLQGFTPPQAYILGKRIIEEKKEICNPFYLAGIVDFEEHDSTIIEETFKGVDWCRRVKTEGAKWKLYPPSVPELYPNMSNAYDYPWHSAKKELAHRTKDITVLWYCGQKQREIAHKNKVYNWDDPKCTTELLGFKNVRGLQLQRILDVNQSSVSSVLPLKHELPKEALKILKPNKLEFYVDFETVSDCTTNFDIIRHYRTDKIFDATKLKPKYSNLIYMIGLGYFDSNRNKWCKKSYMIEHLTAKCESKIIMKFITDMLLIQKKLGIAEYPQIYHWGHAEITTLIKAIERNPKLAKKLSKHSWYDLCEFVKSIPITIKGVFSFGLKDVVKGLYAGCMIPTKWEDEAIDGKAAMFAVINADKRCKETTSTSTLLEDEEMIQITQYNEIDCKVMFEIMEFLRVKYLPKYKSKYFISKKFTPII